MRTTAGSASCPNQFIRGQHEKSNYRKGTTNRYSRLTCGVTAEQQMVIRPFAVQSFDQLIINIVEIIASKFKFFEDRLSMS
jgi:hypothetical protein